tara:strand:+ start:105 stop:365 length:261 start_codon:yes stop_codon:yes gene_type:complete
MSSIEELNKDTLEMIKEMSSKILKFAITANKELTRLETDQQNKKHLIENKLDLIEKQSEQLIHLAATKYRLELRMQQLKQNGPNLK